MFGIGLDCGSASVKATLLSPDGKIQWKAHALHYGRVKYTVHLLLGQLLEQVPNACGFPVGITGSSGDTLVRGLNNLLTLGEIPAIEQGSRLLAPNVRSVIEIGSQSARFLTGIGKGLPPQFSVNEHCAGGTGSFFEDQMSRLGLPMEEYSALVTRATTIPRLSGRCAVFAKTDIIHRQQEGVPTPDILLGLCYAMVRNYKAVIVRSLPVEPPVVLCGGVAQNVGVVQAVQEIFGLSDQELIVPDDFLYTGAVGAAAAVQKKGGCSLGELMANMFASQTEFAGPVGQPPLRLLPGTCLEEPTVTESIPVEGCALGIDVGSTSTDLVLVSRDGNLLDFQYLRTAGDPEGAVRRGLNALQERFGSISFAAVGVTGSGRERIGRGIGADAIRDEITAQATAMMGMGKLLGKPKPMCLPALLAGAAAVRRHTAAVERQGKTLLESLKPEDKVLVLITRNYGLSDPVLNMRIPSLLLERGHKVITLSHLPAHDLDISNDHPNLYWPFGQHILSGAKLVAKHPNLYAVYLTNHGCGPDTMLSHLFAREMGEKPYLQIEVDEHFSSVGVITRIEAFLQSLEGRPSQPLPVDFHAKAVKTQVSSIQAVPDRNGGVLYIPNLPPFTPYIQQYLEQTWDVETRLLELDDDALCLGRAETSSKEYLPFPALLGSILTVAMEEPAAFQVLLPATQGAEADGQYPWAIETVLQHRGLNRVALISPVLERIPERAADTDLLLRAVLTGDVLLCAPQEYRCEIAPSGIPTWEELEALAARVGAQPSAARILAAVGEPLTLFTFDNAVLNRLEQEGWQIKRAPLSEYLWTLGPWKSIQHSAERMEAIGRLLRQRSSFSRNVQLLCANSERLLTGFAGANGRYRLAKAVELGLQTSGLLVVAPRYENAATVMEMTGALQNIPHFSLSVDGDWDETSRSRLESFLYYL